MPHVSLIRLPFLSVSITASSWMEDETIVATIPAAIVSSADLAAVFRASLVRRPAVRRIETVYGISRARQITH